MGIEGIGARVARKEDQRFITGKGRYTDDFKMAGMHHAAFVRSPQAHAKIKGIDKSAAEKMDGVIAVLDGKQLTGDGIGNIICGWMIHSKDGSPMNMGAWSALATEKVRYVGDAAAVVVADTALPRKQSSLIMRNCLPLFMRRMRLRMARRSFTTRQRTISYSIGRSVRRTLPTRRSPVLPMSPR